MIRPKRKQPVKAPSFITSQDCLAKTRKLPTGDVVAGRTVTEHSLIVGEIAKRLSKLYPQHQNLFQNDVSFIASLHDIGKITPAFQSKLKDVINNSTDKASSTVEPHYQYHGGASYLTLKALGFPESLAWALGSHHGILRRSPLAKISSNAEILGGPAWQTAREGFYDTIKQHFQATEPKPTDSWSDRVLGGLTQQADWIGSGPLFDDPSQDWTLLIDKAIEDVGYTKPSVKQGLSFSDIFGFKPRIVQENLINSVTGPGVYILEAPMGIGKTEAALYAAYKMLESGHARGLYFALPTCLTSLKIKDRVDGFLDRILEGEHHQSQLLVGNAAGEMSPGSAWFSHYHRRALDNFGVGTIDQALFAAMLNRRSFVTLSGLAGKVVILDEVHSYDFYTRVFLEILVERLKALQCTVIILSATLSSTSRRKLLFGSNAQSSEQTLDLNYPLISQYPENAPLVELPQPIENSRTVLVELKSCGNADALKEAIERAKDGQQVLWIENSVADSQEIYSTLQSQLGESDIEIGLLHSRFLPQHRAEIEGHWVNLYGKHTQSRHARGRILVGTQVLEQSLDIDADFLITRLAPIDLLLQRLGRLWRHQQTQRPSSTKQEAWILVPGELKSALRSTPKEFRATSIVYYPYVLLRTLEVLELGSREINLPGDMRAMLEAVYSDRDEVGEFAAHLHRMMDGEKGKLGVRQQEQLAKVAAVTEDCTETRLSEPMIDILLLRSISSDELNRQTLIETLGGESIVLPWRVSDRAQQRKIAARLDRELLHLRKSKSVPTSNRVHLMSEYHLHHYLYLGDDQDEPFVWIGIVGDGGSIKTLGRDETASGYCYRFSKDFGFVGLEKIKKESE